MVVQEIVFLFTKMDAMLQEHCARYIYVVPTGLKELMSDISREVIRANPEDMYTFIADYLDALLVTRENARVAARVVQSLIDMAQNAATFLDETDLPRENINQIVEAIKKTFKKSIESSSKPGVSEEVEEANIIEEVFREIVIDPESAEIAAKIIQQAYRRFKERKKQEYSLLAGIIDWRVAARSALRLYRQTGVTNEEANRAATLIKAAYKGYYTRKMLKTVSERLPEQLETEQQLDQEKGLEESTEEIVPDTEGKSEQFSEDKTREDQRTVKINYDTVIPHVEFDEKHRFVEKVSSTAPVLGETPMEKRDSTASSIARYQMSFILDQAIEVMERSGLVSLRRSASQQRESSARVSTSSTRKRSSVDKNGENPIESIKEESEFIHEE